MKKKMHLILTILLSIGFVLPVSAQGIEFKKDNWENIKALSKTQNKLIFIDFGTVWCSPCRDLTKNIFPQKEAGDFYNQNFICIQVDAEKGEGVMLARKFRVGGFPTMIFTNPQEKVIYSFTGSMSVTELINKGKIALTNQDDFDQLKVKYLKDELNKDDLYRYLMIVKMKGSSKDLNEVLDKYVILNPVIDSNMFNTISGNLEYTVTPAFIFLEKNRDEFARLVGRDKVEELIRRLYTKGIGLKAFKDEEDYITTISELNQKICLTEKEQLIIASDHYYQVRDSKNFMAATAALATKYYQNDDEALSLKIGSSFGFNLDQNDLLTVKSWAERAISLKNNTVNALSLAMVYFNLKNKEQALKYINIAFENSLRDKDNEEGHLAVFKKQIEEGKY